MSWDIVISTDYCDSVRDGTHDTPKQSLSGYKLVTGKHIKKGQIDTTDAYYISEKDYVAINQRSLVEQWDVLLSMIGTVGEVAVVKVKPNYAIKNVALFKCGGSKLKGQWLFYYLQSPQAKGHMTGNLKGSSQQFLSLKQLRNLPILITEEKTMQKIVDILSAYDNLIENNQKQIKLLEEAAQRLYKEWFVDLHFPNHENTKITDGVPDGWSYKKLGEILTYIRGKSYTSKELSDNDGKLLVNLKNIQAWGGYKREVEKRFIGSNKENQTLKFGDIIMAVTDMTQERRLVGHVALVPNFNENATFSMDLIKIEPLNNVPSFFLYSVLRFSGISKNISKFANGTNVLHLKPDSIMNIPVLVPNMSLMQAFENIVKDMYIKIEILQTQIIQCKQARDRLLPKLMSGELEV